MERNLYIFDEVRRLVAGNEDGIRGSRRQSWVVSGNILLDGVFSQITDGEVSLSMGIWIALSSSQMKQDINSKLWNGLHITSGQHNQSRRTILKNESESEETKLHLLKLVK